MRPKISVIIVTYNSDKDLEGAILSFKHQDYINKELLVIDGKSKDATISIINKYDSIISFWCSEPDKGIYDAMNKGWKKANGEYILYLGCDDRLLSGGLTALANACHGEDIIYGDVKCLHDNGIIKEKRAASTSIIKTQPFCSHQSLMMRKDMFEKLNGFNLRYRVLADFDLIQRACFSGASLKYVHQYISLFRMGGVSSFTYQSDIDKLRIYKQNRSVRFPYLIFAKNIIIKTLKILKYKIFA